MATALKDYARSVIALPIIMAAIFALAAGVVWPAAASPKPEHFESVVPSNAQEARAVLAESVKGIIEAFQARDYEAVHKITYTAEKAAAVLAELGDASRNVLAPKT